MDDIETQLDAVRRAPIPFVVALLAVGGVLWGALEWRYGGLIDRQSQRIEQLEQKAGITGASDPSKIAIHGLGNVNAPEPRVSAHLDTLSWIKSYRGMTDFQSSKLTERTKGQKLIIKGRVESVSGDSSDISMFLDFPQADAVLQLSLIRTDADFSLINGGDWIELTGVVEPSRVSLTLSGAFVRRLTAAEVKEIEAASKPRKGK